MPNYVYIKEQNPRTNFYNAKKNIQMKMNKNQLIHIYINPSGNLNQNYNLMEQVKHLLNGLTLSPEIIIIVWYNIHSSTILINNLLMNLLEIILKDNNFVRLPKKLEKMHPSRFLSFFETLLLALRGRKLPVSLRIKGIVEENQITHFGALSGLYFMPKNHKNADEISQFLIGFSQKMEEEIKTRTALLKKLTALDTDVASMYHSYHIEEKSSENFQHHINQLRAKEQSTRLMIDVMFYRKNFTNEQLKKFEENITVFSANFYINLNFVEIEDSFQVQLSKCKLGNLMPSCFPLFAGNLLKFQKSLEFEENLIEVGTSDEYQKVLLPRKFLLGAWGTLNKNFLKEHVQFLANELEQQIN